ncbi:MAG: hypothetical protein WCJ74_03380, partial [bacterium]
VETNHATVRNLIESLIRYSGKGGYEVPPSENALHEARLLKLDISKANTLLNWHPVLNFSETIDYTAKGYLAELQTSGDMLNNRLQQIQNYIQKESQNNQVRIFT